MTFVMNIKVKEDIVGSEEVDYIYNYHTNFDIFNMEESDDICESANEMTPNLSSMFSITKRQI